MIDMKTFIGKRPEEMKMADTLFQTFFSFGFLSIVTCKPQINFGFLLSQSSTNYPASEYAGAVTRVIDDIRQNEDLLNGVSIDYQYADTGCHSSVAIKGTLDLFLKNVTVFIGPYCSRECIYGGFISTCYKIPMVTFGCSSILLNDNSTYPYIVRVKTYARMNQNYAPKTLADLLKFYDWMNICMIHRANDIYDPLADETVVRLNKSGMTITKVKSYRDILSFKEKKNILLDMKQNCRIFLFITSYEETMEFLIQAWNLFLREGYGFVTVDFVFSSKWKYDNYSVVSSGLPEVYKRHDGNLEVQSSEELIKRVIMTGLIVIKASSPNTTDPAYNDFRADVLRRVHLPPFNDSTIENYTQISTASVYLYDAAMLFAMAVNQTLRKNFTVENTTAILNEMKNFSFVGKSGTVLIDNNLDRVPYFFIYNYVNGSRNIVATYDPRDETLKTIPNIKTMFPGHTYIVPLDIPPCGFSNEKCDNSLFFNSVAFTVAAPTVVFILFLLGIHQFKNRKYKFKLLYKDLVIDLKDVTFDVSALKRVDSMISNGSEFRKASGAVRPRSSGISRAALYRSKKVYCTSIYQSNIVLNRKILLMLKNVKSLNHHNTNAFIGIVAQSSTIHTLWLYAGKGSLKDVLTNIDLDLDWTFKLSFANDIAAGLVEVHRYIGLHGNLSSTTCLVDDWWTVKLTDFGISFFTPDLRKKKLKTLFYEDPNLLLNENKLPTQKSEIYRYGMILYEITTRNIPYQTNKNNITAQGIIESIKTNSDHPFQPTVPDDVDIPPSFVELMKKCRDGNPFYRPTAKEAMKKMHEIMKKNGINLVDHMLTMMEKHTKNLEEIVYERTVELEQEKLKTENLLYKMLPRSVANDLKEGKPVLAEYFSSVTIYFSDIVGFTSFCSQSTPLEVVQFLNDLYSCFDQCIDLYDVYKVETIGDAYMVASGLPVRNGNKHAAEIATMSLKLLDCIDSFRVRHSPNTQIQLRIGLHTGSCVAGVVGLKMPRYCLFGDTVNMASRMESSGVPLKIHVSRECKQLLEELGNFRLVERGSMHIKGKGKIATYFLLGCDKSSLCSF